MKICVNCTYYRARKTEYADGDCHRLPPNGDNITNEFHWCGEHVGIVFDAMQKDYEIVYVPDDRGQPHQDLFFVIYKGAKISADEIELRLNRLSELEKQNDDISALVLNWTEKVIELSEHVDKNESWDNGYCQGKLEGVELCRDGISDIWKEG